MRNATPMGISCSSRFRHGGQFVPELNKSRAACVGSFSHLRIAGTGGFEYVLNIGFWYEMAPLTLAGVHRRTSFHVAVQPKLLIPSFRLIVVLVHCVLVRYYCKGVPKYYFVCGPKKICIADRDD